MWMVYNSSMYSSSGFTPFYLMFWREPKVLVCGIHYAEQTSVNEFADKLKNGAFEKEKSSTHLRQK